MCVSAIFINILSGCASGGGTSPESPGVPIITPGGAFLVPGQTVQFSVTVNGVPFSAGTWELTASGGATGSITNSGLYSSPTSNVPASVTLVLHDLAHQTFSAPATIKFFQNNIVSPGTVTTTKNPLVASYNIMAPQGSTVSVQFGTTTAYGLSTSTLPAPDGGGIVPVLVAGMRANTTYHMKAMIHLPDGTTVPDTDQSFTTGSIPTALLPNLTVQQTPGLTPDDGVEMLSLFEEASQSTLTAVVSDLSGNVIWYYPIQPSATFPMKLLPNGHILIIVSAINTVQEIDLAGNIISQTSLGDIDRSLADIGSSLPVIYSMHHDMVKLPNGDLMLLVNYNKTFPDMAGSPTVLGDALIEWNSTKGVVWTWSTFDHIPLTHAPNGLADWTHANAVVYSPDDGNLVVSMRNQNWIIKINYKDGAGDGSILWHFGPGGDFTLPAGQDPIEWNYGQHYPTLLGPTAGVYNMMFFNNGNNRLVDSAGDVCGTPGLTFCYSSVPTFQLNENTKTAEVTTETFLSPAYSICCGDALLLPNGNLEADIALDVYSPNVSYIREYTQGVTPELVWQMNITGQLAYRGFRIPSLYPGVSWSQEAITAANAAAKPVAGSPKH